MVKLTDEGPYLVKVARPVFEVAVVALEAASHEEAILKAKLMAASLPEEAWSGEFDPLLYGYDIQEVVDVEFEKTEFGVAEMEDEPAELVRYALARAEIDGGSGSLILQPWMRQESELLIADVAKDWACEAEELSEDGYQAFMRRLDREVGVARDDDSGGSIHANDP